MPHGKNIFKKSLLYYLFFQMKVGIKNQTTPKILQKYVFQIYITTQENNFILPGVQTSGPWDPSHLSSTLSEN